MILYGFKSMSGFHAAMQVQLLLQLADSEHFRFKSQNHCLLPQRCQPTKIQGCLWQSRWREELVLLQDPA